MFGGACGQFVPSPGSVWDGMACKSCAKAKKDHKEFDLAPSSKELMPTTIGAPVAQDAIVIALPQMSASPSTTSTSFAFVKPEKQENSLRSRVSSFKRDWTRERTVVAVVVAVLVLLVIILAATLSGAAEIVGLNAQDQVRLDTANSAMAASAAKLGVQPQGNLTINNSSDFIDSKAMAFMLSNMGLDSMEFRDVSIIPPSDFRTCTQDTDCQSCDDPVGTCDTVLGRCALDKYDANLFDPEISGSCPAGFCNYPYQHDVPTAINALFQGFPTRKKYAVNPLLEPYAPDADFGGLASLAPATTYYGMLNLRGYNFSTMLVLFVPDIQISPDVAFAIRINFKDTNNKNSLLSVLPALTNVPGFAQFDVCKGGVVFSSSWFNRMGFEVVKGANMFLRVRVPTNSPLALLEPYLSPPNKRVFNLRVMLGESFEGEKGSFIDFQKDPFVGVDTRSKSAFFSRLGIQVDSNGGGLVLGSFSKFNFSENLQVRGGLTTRFAAGAAVFNGYVNDVVLPSVIKKYVSIKRMGYTMTAALPAVVLPRDFETVGDVELSLGDYKVGLYVAGKFFTDGNCGFTSVTQLNANEQAIKKLKLGGNSLTTIVSKIANVGSALDFLNGMNLPNSLLFELSVASKAMEINQESIPAGVRVMATLGFAQMTFPKEFQPIVSFLNLGTASEVGVGALIPFGQPNQIEVFVAFSTQASSLTPPVVYFEAFTTRMKPFPPAQVELSVTLQLNFPGNTEDGVQRPLKLVAAGAFAPPSFFVQGALIGEWKDVLGISGLNIINAGGLVGFGAGGINAIGAWGTVDLGLTTSVNFTIVISPAQGQFAWDTHVNDLSFKSVFQIVNKLTNKGLDVPDALVSALSPISIDYLDITVCPLPFSIGGRSIAQGFGVNGSITFLGANVRLSGGLVQRRVAIQGLGVQTVQDLRMAFGVFNVDLLAPVVPLVDFTNWAMPYVRDALSKLDRVCSPEVCVPFAGCEKACGDTPLKGQLDSVMAHISANIGDILRIGRAEVTEVSVWDLMNGGGPQLYVDVFVNGRKISGSQSVKTNFFVQTKVADALPVVAAAVKNTLANSTSWVVDAIESKFCDYINSKLCIDFPSPFSDACLHVC